MSQFVSAERREAIQRTNKEDPLNLAAGELLPADWQDGSSLNVLALALWGIWEAGIQLESEDRPRSFCADDLEAHVLRLRDMEPSVAMKWVQETLEGEEVLGSDALDEKDREGGAFVILEAIKDRLDEAWTETHLRR